MKVNCNFCGFKSREIIYQDDKVWIVHTKDRKGHKKRIMVVTKLHTKKPPKLIQDYAIKKLTEIGKKVFDYVPAFCILSDTHSRFPNHWHRVGSDFRGDDIEKILDTKHKIIWMRKTW